MRGSGQIMSPGYTRDEKSYPDLAQCTWTIHAPTSDISLTIQFENFQLHSTDKLHVSTSYFGMCLNLIFLRPIFKLIKTTGRSTFTPV